MGVLESGRSSFAAHRRSCSACTGVLVAVAILQIYIHRLINNRRDVLLSTS